MQPINMEIQVYLKPGSSTLRVIEELEFDFDRPFISIFPNLSPQSTNPKACNVVLKTWPKNVRFCLNSFGSI